MNSQVASYKSLKQENARLNQGEADRGALTLASLPRYVMVELTQGCNLHCPMCRPERIHYRDRALDRSLLTSIAEQIFPTAEIVDIRGWGESLIAPDVDQIIDLVASYGARCRIVTNLSVSRPDTLDHLVDVGAMIDVSVDSVDPDVIALCRPGSNWPLIESNLKRLANRLEGHGRINDLRAIVTLQNSTLAGLETLVDVLSRLGMRQIVLNEVTLAKDDPNAVNQQHRAVNGAVLQAVRMAEARGIELYAGTSLGSCVGVMKDVAHCLHPWSHATVGYDGSVGYCDHLIGSGMERYCTGNAVSTPFADIWNGSAWQDLRHWHATDRRQVAEPAYRACFGCYKHRNVDFEDMLDPRLLRTRLDGHMDVAGNRVR